MAKRGNGGSCEKESKPLDGRPVGLGHLDRPRACKDSRLAAEGREREDEERRRRGGNGTDASTRSRKTGQSLEAEGGSSGESLVRIERERRRGYRVTGMLRELVSISRGFAIERRARDDEMKK